MASSGEKRLTLLDGGMGTLLQARGLAAGETPEDWNVERPDDIAAIHRAYIDAGAQIIYANTFGANPLKYRGRHSLEQVIRGALEIARGATGGRATGDVRREVRVALDLGPTGRLLEPAGDLSFDDCVAAYAEVIRLATTPCSLFPAPCSLFPAPCSLLPVPCSLLPDLVVIETMGDVRELKAAVIAAKENCSLPVYATVSLGEDGKLLTGGSVECVAALLESLGVDAYGFNCGLGPAQMLPYVKRLAAVATKPIIVKPNAGLPKVVGDKTVYTVDPATFAREVGELVAAGASIVGGCCGTTPEHIEKLNTEISISENAGRSASQTPSISQIKNSVFISSGTSVVELKSGSGLIIGERINPTGKKALKEAYAKGDTAYVLREAVKQVDAGAEILDVNCGVPGLDERALLDSTVSAVQGVVTCPLQIDTADPAALERALRHVNGKPLVNSVNGKRESMDAVFPLVRKYGGAIVALCLDERGIPPTSEGRLAIARRILAEGANYGFAKSDFVFDALTLAVSSDPQAAIVTLETVRRLTDELGVNTVLGVSNVSFGLPNRPALNNAMYALAVRAGLSAAIANPAVIRNEIDPAAEDVLMGRDANCARWIESNKVDDPKRPYSTLSDSNLSAAIRRGLKEDARVAAEDELKKGAAALEIIDTRIVPALEEVGRGFEKGTVFLPQLLMAADAAGSAFGVIKAAMSSGSCLKSSRVSSFPSQVSGPDQTEDMRRETLDVKRPIVLATVRGDIHDIGKNIVRALLENYGFDVIDLGRDVPPEKIVATARETNAALVGLSALMTTTVGAMAETIRQLKSAGLACKTVVGGAVVTQEYADSIGADFYAKDAMRTVRIAESLKARG